MRTWKFSSFAFLLALLPKLAGAAPCCGGSISIPSLLTGDDAGQVSASLSQSAVIGDAPVQGIPVFRSVHDSETSQTFKLDGAYRLPDLLDERSQVGLTLPLVRRSRSMTQTSDSAFGLGDVAANFGYELLPEKMYSIWKPRGFAYLQSVFPTSPSTYDAETPLQVDARGRGFFQLGVGALLIKSWGSFDAMLGGDFHRSFKRRFNAASGGEMELTPAWGAVGSISAGYSPESIASGALRFGMGLSPAYEGAIDVTGPVNLRSSSQLVWNTSAQLAYMFPEWTANLTYVDQTLVGPARNVTLSRSFAFLLQHRWPL